MEEQDYNMALSISTHTLTWSVTCTGFTFCACFKNFNSHAHVERDPINSFIFNFQSYFNSHAHVERDTMGSACVAEFFNFNSHAHVERD